MAAVHPQPTGQVNATRADKPRAAARRGSGGARVPRETTKAEDGERKCLATAAMLPKDRLIRFVIGPDHAVVPDLAQNLPGRGLWVTADRDAIQLAASKNLFAKAAKASARPDKDLAGLVAGLLKARCLSLLGLARSAGIAVLGQLQVEQAMKADQLQLLLLATDASETYQGFVGWRSKTTEQPTKRQFMASQRFTREELGGAFGQAQSVYVGLTNHALTEKIKLELARLEKVAPIAHIKPATDNG